MMSYHNRMLDMRRTEERPNGTKPAPPGDSNSNDRDRRQHHRPEDNPSRRVGSGNQDQHHRHHHRHCHRGHGRRSGTACPRDDASLDNGASVCSNRMVQIAVVVLVLIMAIW